ncbi:MAG: hypothetical protein ABSE62_14185, partial [Chthoniobacteraceae bacterium]
LREAFLLRQQRSIQIGTPPTIHQPLQTSYVAAIAAITYAAGLDGAVDGDLLVVALALADGVIGRREKALRGQIVRDGGSGAVTLPELGGGS